MKILIIKLTAVLLAVILSAAVMVCCADDTPGAGDTTAATAETTVPAETDGQTELVPSLPDTKWDRSFRVLGCGDTASDSFLTFEIFAEDLTAEPMNDAVYTRNEAVKKKYGITVEQTLEKTPDTRIAREIASGDDNFDLVFAFLYKIGGLALKGYFYDMNTVEHIDFTKPWWNADVNEVVSLKGHVFYTSSDFSLRDKNRVQCMVLNDALRNDLNLSPVPELVRSNAWTAEKMLEYVKAAASDLSGDGKVGSDDRFGLVMHAWDAFANLCFGFGVRLVDKDSDGNMIICADPEHGSEAVDKALAIFAKELTMTPEDYGRNWDINSDTFVAGRALFSMNSVAFVKYYNENCDFDYTICPNPKFDSDQEKYVSIPDIRCMMFGILSSSKTPDFSGFALEALSYESTDSTLVTFIELVCKSRNLRNADSVEMVNIIFDGVIYDCSLFFTDSLSLYAILNTTIPTVRSNSFVRLLESGRKRNESALESINGAFKD